MFIYFITHYNQYNVRKNIVVKSLQGARTESPLKNKKITKKVKKFVLKVLTFSKRGHILLAIKAKDC